MSPLLYRGLGAALGVLVTFSIAALSRAPYQLRTGDLAMIRLTWRARPEQIETCRTPSAEELAALLAHMRQQVICEGFSARYRLKVALGGASILEEVIRGSGLRHDRPMYLLRDLPTPPGRHELEVSFVRIDSVAATHDEDEESAEANDPATGIPSRIRRETEERQRRRLEAVPPALVLHQDVVLAPRQLLVVTYHAERRQLVLLPEAPPR